MTHATPTQLRRRRCQENLATAHIKSFQPADQKHLRRTDASCPFRLEEGWVLGASKSAAHSLTIGKAGQNSTRFEVVVSTDEYGLEIRADLKTQLFSRVERYRLSTFSRRTKSVAVPTSGRERENLGSFADDNQHRVLVLGARGVPAAGGGPPTPRSQPPPRHVGHRKIRKKIRVNK